MDIIAVLYQLLFQLNLKDSPFHNDSMKRHIHLIII